MSEQNIVGGTGITSGGDVKFGDVSGQVAIGENISQSQSIKGANIEELKKSLLDFQKGLVKLDLSEEDESIINGNISAAIKESKKDKPKLSVIKDRFEDTIDIIKESGKTIQSISDLYEPAKKLAKLVGLGIAVLV
jgi:polyribonucleotide nucleotidyltransferase